MKIKARILTVLSVSLSLLLVLSISGFAGGSRYIADDESEMQYNAPASRSGYDYNQLEDMPQQGYFGATEVAAVKGTEWIMDLVYIIMSSDTADEKMQAIIAMLGSEGAYGLWIFSAIEMIAKSGIIDEDTLEKLAELIDESDWRIKRFACLSFTALAEGGQTVPDETVEKIVEQLNSTYRGVYLAANNALLSIAESGQQFTEEAINSIARVLNYGNWNSKRLIPTILATITKSGQTINSTAIEEIIELMDRNLSEMRLIACYTLGLIAEGGQLLPRSIQEKIIRLFQDDIWTVREMAAKTMGRFTFGGHQLSREALEGLIELLNDGYLPVREASINSLTLYLDRDYKLTDSAIADVVELLSSETDYIKKDARTVYNKIIESNDWLEYEKLDGLVLLLTSENKVIQDFIKQILILVAANDQETILMEIEKINTYLQTDDPWECEDMLVALNEMVIAELSLPDSVVATIIEKLDNENRNVRDAACITIGNIADTDRVIPEEGITKVIELLRDNWVHNSAAASFGKIGKSGQPIPDSAIAILVELMSDEDWKVRRDACWALGDIVEGGNTISDAAIEGLVEKLEDRVRFTRRAACWSFANIAASGLVLPDEAVEGIISLLEDEDWYVRRDSCWVLSEIAEAGQLLPSVAKVSMMRLLDDSNIYVRLAACQSLTRIVEAGQILPASAVESIVKLLQEDNMVLHNTVRESLSRMAQTGQIFPSSAINRIIQPQVMQSRVFEYNTVTMNVILDNVQQTVDYQFTTVHWTAPAILKGIVKAGQKLSDMAISRIIQQLSDSDSLVREAAYEVLGVIVEAGQPLSDILIGDILYYLDEDSNSSDYAKRAACMALCKVAKAGQEFDSEDMIETIKTCLLKIYDTTIVLPVIDLYLKNYPEQYNELIRALANIDFQFKDPLIHLISMLYYNSFTSEGLENTIFIGDDNVKFRRYSYMKLLNTDIPDIQPYLSIGMQLEMNSYVIVPVLQEIGQLALDEFRPVINEYLTDDSPYVRMYAAAIAGNMGLNGAADQLKTLFEDEKETPNIKIWCAASLIMLGEQNPQYWNYLIDALEATGPEYEHPEGIDRVFNGFSMDVSYKTTVRRTAVIALSDLGDDRAIPYLIELINDETFFEENREENYEFLVKALKAFGNQAVNAVAELLSSDVSDDPVEQAKIQRNALKMLFNLSNPAAIAKIQANINNINPSVISYAEMIIERLNDL